MKKKRTDKGFLSAPHTPLSRGTHNHRPDPFSLGLPALGEKVEVNNREQFQHIVREIALLKRHTTAIEADVYQSMFLICRSANRFLAPRRARIEALVAGLMAVKSVLWHKTKQKGVVRPEPGKTGKKPIHRVISHPLTEEA